MASEKIHVQIDINQVKNQKMNNYSLFLAKVVNNKANIIWQALVADASSGNSCGYDNTFDINIPSYMVNYTTNDIDEGSTTFKASGKPMAIELGQTVSLDQYGGFQPPMNTGTTGSLVINNKLPGNPHSILLDHNGNTIFINDESGMNVDGSDTLTPIDHYQLWFGNLQESGTIIVKTTGKIMMVTFDGGTAEKTVSFNAKGLWQDGPLA